VWGFARRLCWGEGCKHGSGESDHKKKRKEKEEEEEEEASVATGTLYCNACFTSYHPVTRSDRVWESHWQVGETGVNGSSRLEVLPAPWDPLALTLEHLESMRSAYEGGLVEEGGEPEETFTLPALAI